MNIKHSKYKNTGLLFELIVRQITADTLSGIDSKATGIMKKFFVKSELGKEYKLYETISKHKNISEAKADMILTTVIESSKSLNRSSLKRQKYNLIKEISKHYNLEEFFKIKLPSYKTHASLYTLLEIYNSEVLSNPDQIIDNKISLLEYMVATPIKSKKVENDLMEEFKSYPKDLRILTYKVMLENFNGKYGTLNDDQKDVLKEFINSVDNTPRLKEFYNGKVFDLKEKLNKILPNIENKATQIKLNEVTNLLSPLSKTSNVSDDDLINLLQYCELLEEIKKSNGKK
jgi:hypothetical protein|tara:strand:- start:329 stop:1192 length:864 start_codon:yes stop_codon:yes gene_type:complete